MSAGLALDASVFGNGNGHGANYGHGSNGFDLSSLTMSLSKSTAMGNGVDDEDEPLHFQSSAEEATWYREKYRVAVDLLNETRAELDEFQESSRELEQELEKELQATENRQAELRDRINRLEAEKDDWKTKFVNLQKTHGNTTAAMQREMDNLRSERDKALVAVRDLEMGNDQLERNERVAVSSLLDMEIKYNRAIEEKTLLEQEVIQRSELDEECQRLKDDVRDANNEIAILRDQLARVVVPTPPASETPMSPATDRTLHSRATSHSSRSNSRLDASSPTPTDRSTATDRSSTATERTDKANATPRNRVPLHGSPRRVPRSTSTPTGLSHSPSAARRNTGGLTSSPSPSGIPSLSRSTTRPNLAAPAQGSQHPLGMSMANRRVLGATNAAANAPSVQATKNKGFKLLHDLQARIKTTDDKIGKMVKKAPAGFSRRPAPAPPTASSSSSAAPSNPTSGPLTLSTIRSRTVSRGRAANLSMSLSSSTATVTPGMRDDRSVGVLSPSGWVVLDNTDNDQTPPANRRATNLRNPQTPSSPLDRSTRSRPPTTKGNKLPSRPSIPSPLVRETKARHIRTESMKMQNGLSAASIVPPTAPRTRPPPAGSTSRPPSRGHTRASSSVAVRSGAASPSLIPGPRRMSMGPSTTLEAASPTIPDRLAASTSRPATRATLTRSHTPTPRSHTPSGSISGIHSIVGGPPPPVPPRRVARRSSLGITENAPPSGIPGPKLGLGRPNSMVSTPPPVPRIPSAVQRAKSPTY